MAARSRTPALVVVNLVAALLVGLDVGGFRYDIRFGFLDPLLRARRPADLLPVILAVLVCVIVARTRLARYGWFLSAAGAVGLWTVGFAYLPPAPVYPAACGLGVGLLGSGVVGAFAASPPSRIPVVLGSAGGVAIGLLADGTPTLSGGMVFPSGLALLLCLAGVFELRAGPPPGPRLNWNEIAGIVDGAAVRVSGYLAGPHDIPLTSDDIARYGLRRGDAVTGVARAGSLVRIDAIHGLAPSVNRPDFYELQPAEPRERLRLSGSVVARVVDLVMPVGKGQRALIVAPPRTGATTTLRAIGDALPSGCHRMLVLVDQRPEDVASIRRDTTNSEVIASTVDMTPEDHVELAALVLDRAQRLVELGHDVVMLLDSVTRLGRAHQAVTGRLVTAANFGGLDAAAVSALRHFLGAARAIEGGGSLTIVAAATAGTGSPIEAAILDELKDTVNAELWLRSDSTVEVSSSGTRQASELLSPSEQEAAARLRELLPTMDPEAALASRG